MSKLEIFGVLSFMMIIGFVGGLTFDNFSEGNFCCKSQAVQHISESAVFKYRADKVIELSDYNYNTEKIKIYDDVVVIDASIISALDKLEDFSNVVIRFK